MLLDATRWRAFAGALTVCVILASAGSVKGQLDDIGVGARVVLRDGAELQADDGAKVDVRRARRLFRVDRVQNDWLWVVSDRVSAWVRPTDVVPIGRALEYLTEEAAAHPRAAWAYVVRGLLWEEMKEPLIALSEYTEALGIDPNDAEARLRRAHLRKQSQHDLKRALADYDEAIRLDPKLPGAHHERGEALLAAGRYEQAIADFGEALKLDPKDAGALHGRGIAWQLQGDLDHAIEDYNAALILAPADPVVYLNRGNAWCDRRDYDKALADYSAAIKLDKFYVLAYNNRGIVWRLRGECEKAVSDHNVAVRLAPRDHSGYLLRGIAWKQLKEYDRAVDDYNGAVELEPRCAEALNGRAWILATCPEEHIRNGRISYDSAVRACELTGWRAAHQLDTLAAAYAEAHDFAHAAEWEEKAIALAHNDGQRDDFAARLRMYQDKRAFRDVPELRVAGRRPAPPETHAPAMSTASTP